MRRLHFAALAVAASEAYSAKGAATGTGGGVINNSLLHLEGVTISGEFVRTIGLTVAGAIAGRLFQIIKKKGKVMSSKNIGRGLSVAAVCGALTVPLVAGPASASAAPGTPTAPVVVVSGLNNPRGLSLVQGDALLIAEAGKGGTLTTLSSPDGPPDGLGATGSISLVLAPATAHNQKPHRIIAGLLSGASATASQGQPIGSNATGPDGVAATTLNRIAVIETTFAPGTPSAYKADDGHLLLAKPYGAATPFANITRYEVKHDPDHQGAASDPYGVINYRGGWLVADAAANDVLRVRPSGAVSLFHVFPNVTTGACASQFDPAPPFAGCNFVPTSMAAERNGDVLVGGLSGLTPGAARVVELGPDGRQMGTWGGFSAINGLAVGPDGSVYVSQLMATEAHPVLPVIQGVLTRIHDGHRTNVDVPFPGGVAVDRHNNVYVSAFSVLPSTGAGVPGLNSSGQVWRLRF